MTLAEKALVSDEKADTNHRRATAQPHRAGSPSLPAMTFQKIALVHRFSAGIFAASAGVYAVKAYRDGEEWEFDAATAVTFFAVGIVFMVLAVMMRRKGQRGDG